MRSTALLTMLWAVATQVLPLAATEITVGPACTLADAIIAANTNAPRAGCPAGSAAVTDVIVMTADVELTTADNPGNGLPVITDDLRIEGNGFAIRRNSAESFRILDADFFGSLELVDLTVENGRAAPTGLGILGGGGVRIQDSLIVRRCHFLGNSAPDTSMRGGAVLSPSATLAGAAQIYDSVFSGNSAGLSGGGMYLWSRPVVIEGTLLVGNSAASGGGATLISLGGKEITNSTFSGNAATGAGGGLASYNGTTIVSSTFVANQSGEPSSVDVETIFNNGSLIVSNSLFTGTCQAAMTTDQGGNFGCGLGPAVTGLDPVLRSNGGPTQTHALLAGSNALDLPAACSVSTDQRGAFRIDGACDSGAYERDGCFDDINDLPPAGAAPPDDDSCRNGTDLAIFGGQSHRLCDEDFLFFDPTSGATYEIETSNLGGGADTALELWSTRLSPAISCFELLAMDDDGGVDLASKITWIAEDGELLAVMVSEPAGGYADGKSYDITVRCIADCQCYATDGLTVDLMDDTVVSPETYEVCDTNTLGPNYAVKGPNGSLTLRAGARVVFGEGFSVLTDGVLSVETTPLVLPRSTVARSAKSPG
ncbi:MAG: hypothetical protein OES47_09610 [Acidobacteriota bacterium]|nr:hypothetical protein [Acidobacteriota bacterium]